MPSLKPSILHWTGAAAVLAIMLAPDRTWSQQPARQWPLAPAVASGSELLLSWVQPEQTLDRYLDVLRNDFFLLDADVDGKITPQDIDRHALMEAVQLRTIALSFMARFDLDGDGTVTEDEARRGARYEVRLFSGLAAFKPPAFTEDLEKRIEGTVSEVMAMDADKDGKVTYSEAAAFTKGGMKLNFELNGHSARARYALTLGSASKDSLSLPDYQAAGEALFHKIDSDHDGKISGQELADYRRQTNQPDAASRR